MSGQGTNGIAIGLLAGSTGQQQDAIAIGTSAGLTNQGLNAIAIGNNAGEFNQTTNAIAIGCNAGQSGQATNAIAIGVLAGATGQGSNSIAIGRNAGLSNQPANTIILNAEGTALNGITASSSYIAPIRNITQTNVLGYDTTNKEITYWAKTFVIDHPLDNNKYLVHSCLEGPEAGVYYRGSGIIQNNEFVEIKLPPYIKSFYDFTIQITPKSNTFFYTSDVDINSSSFNVYGKNGSFFWLVHATRNLIDIEPYKNDYNLKGNGPYKWIEKK